MSRATSRQLQFWVACVVVVFSATAASAENTIIESFDYAIGETIGGKNGGSGWEGAWTAVAGSGTITTAEGTLSYPDLPNAPAGGKMFFDEAFSSTSSFRVFSTGFSSGSVYVSFIMDSLAYDHPDPMIGDVVGGRFAGIALFSANGTTAANEKTLLGQGSQPDGTPGDAPWIGMNRVKDNGSLLVGSLGSNAAANFLPAGRADVQSLIVAKIEFDAGGTPSEPQAGFNTDAELITLWLNPDLSLPEEANVPIGGGSFATERDFGEFKRIRIGGGGYADPVTYAKHVIDEIRISDVSPFATIAPTLPGDFNDDGTVDAADYVMWRKGVIPPAHADEDYGDFFANFGMTAGGEGGGSGAVPEPASLVLVGVAFGLAVVNRRRRTTNVA